MNETKEEKINFLEEIINVAEKNPEIITKNGRGIFSADCAPMDEKCVIGLHLDNKGKAYFKVEGTYLASSNLGRIYSPVVLLNVADRYFSRYVDKFKNSFFLTETREGGEDLLDKIR